MDSLKLDIFQAVCQNVILQDIFLSGQMLTCVAALFSPYFMLHYITHRYVRSMTGILLSSVIFLVTPHNKGIVVIRYTYSGA